MVGEVTIYHNPRCSKSRATLALIEEAGYAPQIILYIKTPPTTERLGELLEMMDMPAQDLLRKKEPAYRELGLDREEITDSELISAMIENPVLIERPIVVVGARAVLCRPPERVLGLLD